MKPTLKQKPCKVCKTKFQPFNSLTKVCSPKCAIELVRMVEAQKQKRELRERKQKLKTLSEHKADAQKACNVFIRYRDKDEPCISCGRYDHEIKESFVGGKWDAGHYKSRGAFPELRFHPANIHKQCKSCNCGSGKYARKNRMVSEEYDERVKQKIGQQMYDWLNGPHKAQNLTIDDALEIKQYYREQLRILKKRNNN